MDKKALNLPILISLVIGNMIGTGIYVLPSSLSHFGSISLLSWIYTSIGALFLALTFAHLNKRFPKTGGPYIFCKEAFGQMIGFMVAYIYWMSYLVSIAGIAVASIGYLGFILPELNANTPFYHPYYTLFLELAAVWLFTIINLIGIHTAGVVQLILTIVKILPLILVSLVGLKYINLENLSPFVADNQTPLTAMFSAATLVFWAFVGLEAATVPAENTQGHRDIYRATVYGTLLTAIIYILSTFVLMGMIPSAQLKSSQFPFALAGSTLFGPYSAILIALCAVISGLGAMNVCILIQGQIVFAAARDHLFPHFFAKLSKHDVPIAGQLFSSTIVSLFLILTIEPTLLKQFDKIALLAALLTLSVYFVTTLAEFKFMFKSRISFAEIIRSKSFFITLLAALYSAWMILSFNMNSLMLALMIFLICIPIYGVIKSHIPKS